MIKILTILIILLSSCSTISQINAVNQHQEQTDSEWLTLLEIKYIYNLSNRECNTIIKAIYKGELPTRFNIRKDRAEYPADYDYLKFKIQE